MNESIERYASFMESISTAVPANLREVVTPDIRFKDPFNDVTGMANFEAIIDEMCRSLDQLRIDITHAGMVSARHSIEAGEAVGVIRWDLSGVLVRLNRREWHVRGYSELSFADDGRVCEHIDYWDAAGGLYEQLPLVGGLCRWVRGRLALNQ